MSKPKSPKLSDAQLVTLTAAAQRADGSLLPLPTNLSAKGAALEKLVRALCKRGLVEERKVTSGEPEWRRDDDGRPLGLFITQPGLLALGVDETENSKPTQVATGTPARRKAEKTEVRRKVGGAPSAPKKPAKARSRSKQDLVLEMLRRRAGITVEEVIEETGWQPHSVRGFFSGFVKKKLKLPLTSELGKDGVRRYRVTASSKA